METRNKTLYLAIGGAIVVLIILGILSIFRHPANSDNPSNTGTAEIVFSVTDTDQLGLRLNNKVVAVTSLDQKQPLAPGSYTMSVTKPGYRDFSTTFAIKKNQTVVVNVALQRTKPIPPLTNISQILTTGGQTLQGWTMTATQSFGDGSWAFVTVLSNYGSGASVVADYDAATGSWEAILGPNTIFTSAEMQGMPSDLATYMQQNGYVTDGAS